MISDYERGWLAAMAAIANYCEIPQVTDVSMVRDYAFYTQAPVNKNDDD